MMEIPIVFKNDDFIVLNKPSGISIHNDEDPTNLLKVVAQQLDQNSPVPLTRGKLFPPHRLDKETSGLQILAFNESMARQLSNIFASREMTKIYAGIVTGKVEGSGKWEQALSDKAEGAKNPQGQASDRKIAITYFKSLDHSNFFSLLEFQIETGRQHQIRKHCLLNKHVLIGDHRYGKPQYNQKIAEIYGFNRLALHCKILKWHHFFFEIEEPKEFREVLEKSKKT